MFTHSLDPDMHAIVNMDRCSIETAQRSMASHLSQEIRFFKVVIEYFTCSNEMELTTTHIPYADLYP